VSFQFFSENWQRWSRCKVIRETVPELWPNSAKWTVSDSYETRRAHITVADRRRQRDSKSATRRRKSDRYQGAVPCSHGQKAMFKMAAAAILNFKNVNNCWSKLHDFSLRYGDLAIFKIAAVRPPSWICYDVTIVHCRTHFCCQNIVLKFHVDRSCSFRDTCNIIRQPFGCTERTMTISGLRLRCITWPLVGGGGLE